MFQDATIVEVNLAAGKAWAAIRYSTRKPFEARRYHESRSSAPEETKIEPRRAMEQESRRAGNRRRP